MADPEEPDPPPPPEGDEQWWPGYPDINQMYRHPAFTVQRPVGGYIVGGDYVRGSADANALTAQTAVRYPITSAELAEEAAKRGILYSRAYDYTTVELFWGIPGRVFSNWAEVAIIRSAFGYPATVNDGQTIFRYYKQTLFPPEDYPPETYPAGMPENFTFQPIHDTRLTSGRFYYYSLFFRIKLEWTRSMTTATLLPRDHHHAEHLWNTLPPYYQWIDNQQRDTDGDLRRFFRVFGFELDTTREFVENWQELYHIDFTPAALLRRLGPTYGVPYESGIGEIRYRGLLAELGTLYGIRGTRPCLERVCEAVSKYECDVTQTGNLMTLPDDSDFFEGTGNWAVLNPTPVTKDDTILGAATTTLAPNKVFLRTTKTVLPPAGYGRGVMQVWTAEADELTDIILTCGDGVAYDVYTGKDDNGNDLPYAPRFIYPIQVGILADVGGVYQFAVQVKMDNPSPVGVTILWYDTEGGATDYIGKTDLTPSAPPDTNWKAYQTIGAVPANAVYAVPAIYIKNRVAGADSPTDVSPNIYIAGATLSLLGSASRVSSEGPNPYLQMGNPAKRMGDPIDTPPPPDPGLPALPAPYPGYQIGKKEG